MVERSYFEAREHNVLSRYAAFADASRGRRVPEKPDRYRTCYQQDRDRILHSKSFRRLANKTQVFLAPEGDHFRTRLTHTLEVAQISRDICRALLLNEDLCEAIALGHDLGHTPFGHAGERALQRAKAKVLGVSLGSAAEKALFLHNEQSVRVVEHFERGGKGLNLTFEVLDGMVCHAQNRVAKTLEGQVVAKADRIAYVNHDIDDAIRAGLLSEDKLPKDACKILGNSSSERIQTLVEDIIQYSWDKDSIDMSPLVRQALLELRGYLFQNLYLQGDAKSEEPKAEQVVGALFDYYYKHPHEMPAEYLRESSKIEVQVADYISSMTDRYAIRVYKELFVPKAWGLS